MAVAMPIEQVNRAAPVLRGGCQPTSPGDAVITRRDPVLPADMVERLRFGHAE
jgi:hypothetical protein